MGKADNNNRIELSKMVEICIENDIDISTFLEIGSKDGEDSEYIRQKLNLSEENIFILEAHPLFYKKIKKKYPNFNLYNIAAWNKNGKVPFNCTKGMSDGRSSILNRDIYIENYLSIAVDSRRVDHMINNEFMKQIDLVKLDVEGASFEVLEGFGESLRSIKIIQVETEQYQIWEGQKTSVEVYRLLEDNDFKKIWELKLGKTQIDSIWIRNEN